MCFSAERVSERVKGLILCLINHVNHIKKSFRHVPISGWEGFKEAVCTAIRG